MCLACVPFKNAFFSKRYIFDLITSQTHVNLRVWDLSAIVLIVTEIREVFMFCFDIFLFSSKVVMMPKGDEQPVGGGDAQATKPGKDATDLFNYAKGGNTDAINNMQERLGVDAFLKLLREQHEKWKDTPFHIAALDGYTEAIVAMLKGLNPNQRLELLKKENKDRDTPLHYAASSGTEAIEAMLEGLNPNQRLELLKKENKDRDTPLHCAASSGTEAIEAMLEGLELSEKFELLKKENEERDTPLHCAALKGHTDAIKTMLKKLDPNQRLELLKVEGKDNNTPLHLAALNGHADAIKAMLEKLEPDQIVDLLKVEGKDNDTPLHYAITHSYIGSIKAMLEKLDPDKRVEVITSKNLLHFAAWNGQADAIEAMLAPLNQGQIFQLLGKKAGKNEYTPLHLLALKGHTEAIKAMLTPLSPDQIVDLLKKGAGKDNDTPLHSAITHWYIGSIKAMLEKLDPDKRVEVITSGGLLHFAATNGQADAIKVMLDGLSKMQIVKLLNQTNDARKTPLQTAIDSSKEDVVALLKQNLTEVVSEQMIECVKESSKVDERRLNGIRGRINVSDNPNEGEKKAEELAVKHSYSGSHKADFISKLSRVIGSWNVPGLKVREDDINAVIYDELRRISERGSVDNYTFVQNLYEGIKNVLTVVIEISKSMIIAKSIPIPEEHNPLKEGSPGFDAFKNLEKLSHDLVQRISDFFTDLLRGENRAAARSMIRERFSEAAEVASTQQQGPKSLYEELRDGINLCEGKTELSEMAAKSKAKTEGIGKEENPSAETQTIPSSGSQLPKQTSSSQTAQNTSTPTTSSSVSVTTSVPEQTRENESEVGASTSRSRSSS